MKSQRGSLSFMICNQLLFRGEKVMKMFRPFLSGYVHNLQLKCEEIVNFIFQKAYSLLRLS